MSDSIPAFDTAEPTAISSAGVTWATVLSRTDGRLGAALIMTLALAATLGPALAPADPFALVGPPLAPPSNSHWMGTDALGRDLFSSVLHGARTSLLIGTAVGALVFVIGTIVGGVSGYYGGGVDDAMMRGTEFVQAVPRFFLAIAAVALLGPGIDRLVAVLALTSWTGVARVVRARVLSLREQEFIIAARATGAPERRILSRHILPNVAPAALVVVGLVMGQVLLVEASLGFLGLADPNTVSWGALAAQAQQFLRSAWWLALFPGAAIAVAVLGFNLLSDAAASAAQAS